MSPDVSLHQNKIYKPSPHSNYMKLKPIGERIILKPTEQEEKTKSGIYLPKSEDRKEGTVVETGQSKDGSFIPLQKGDKVIYGGYSNEDIEINGEKFIIVELKDILAKLEENQ
jgi:chaperonin GroES